jgi:hypothetical protein
MWAGLLNVLTGVVLFSGLDSVLQFYDFQGVYYGVHAFHNTLIVASTWKDVVNTFLYFDGINSYKPNYDAIQMCFALHLYHCLLYWRKFRFDDWLHHGLMIGVALPIGCLVPSATLIGFNLFFTTGLPGGLDYLMLFCVRNGWMDRMDEKSINRWIQVWIRSPGCQWQVALTAAYMFSLYGPWYLKMVGLIPPILTYWNGQYFMDQVVADYAIQVDRGTRA